MKIIRGINQIRKLRNPVVALGVFDGVHIGHREILKAVVQKARSVAGRSVVVTFWPHPQREESLYSLEHRLRLIEEIGIDVCIVINFNRSFAKISAEDFVKNILVNRLGAHYIYIGMNFRFGKGAAGNYNILEELSGKYNFKLKVFDVIKINNRIISSTYIRRLIKKGKLNDAQKLLMRRVSILGTVIKGDLLGRQLGFPTANINPHHEIIPPWGIYSVHVILDNHKFDGACYIGTRPTIMAEVRGKRLKGEERIEVHMFNFMKNIYGKNLEIQFIKRIRGDKKFDSVADLITQIKKDIRNLK